ncbi:hypothetical protein ACQP2F_21990 [Actinoplanes sp. CA-030573]|uniref:hypothetical protein n=1 Tax=Actinoplanes sp. CA-030573 TaxID=3239898 RepID=UPI003D933451
MEPAIWLAMSASLVGAAGAAFTVWREKIRARSRRDSLHEALRKTRPADRAKIIEALAKYERQPPDARK